MEYGVVLGAPRSGTTFLMSFLDAMPRTEAVTGNLLPTVIPHLINFQLPPFVHDALVGAFRRSLTDYSTSGLFNSRSSALRKWFAARDGLVRAAIGQRSVDRIIYKEPFLAFAPEYTYESLPGARLIYIVRDGRDVADSLVRTYDVLTDQKLTHMNTAEAPMGREWGGRFVPWWVEVGREDDFLSASAYVRAIWMWAVMVRRCRAFFSEDRVIDQGGVLHIRYEDMVDDPQEWGRRITEHIGGAMTRRMRHRIESAHSRSIGTYKRRTTQELTEAVRVAGVELRAHGYC
jgi:hypothetical protein